MRLLIQGMEIEQHFFLLGLGGTYMVLGMDWLASLGDVEANFKNLTLKWEEGGHKRMLLGEPSLSKNQASWKSMVKALGDEGKGFYLSCEVQEGTTDDNNSQFSS